MLDRKVIRTAAAQAIKADFVQRDPNLAALKKAKAGTPALVVDPTGEPAFWLVPFLIAAHACGLARVSLSGQVAQVGAFGAGAEDRQSWIPAQFFEQPPQVYLAEIQERYAGGTISPPVLSYDGGPARWGWRLKLSGPQPPRTIFITPGGWYERNLP